MVREPDPCDECGAAPAVIRGLCGGCWDRLCGSDREEDFDDEDATDEEFDESAWFNWRTKEPL